MSDWVTVVLSMVPREDGSLMLDAMFINNVIGKRQSSQVMVTEPTHQRVNDALLRVRTSIEATVTVVPQIPLRTPLDIDTPVDPPVIPIDPDPARTAYMTALNQFSQLSSAAGMGRVAAAQADRDALKVILETDYNKAFFGL